MKISARILPLLVAVTLCVLPARAQDPSKPLGEVTVFANDPIYKSLRGTSALPDAFTGEYATVNNLVLKKDAAVFPLRSGAIYFLKPTEGKTTGAVFVGSGELNLVPPVDVEKKHLQIFVDAPEVRESF